ncbi:MAG: hypothetical protein DRJ50_04040 [Actinobacteria bacterium]|nr:MAG: hypothetical protein DRJ50_04040 [Actinomycetota bacterium]
MRCRHDREIRSIEAEAQEAVDDGTWTPAMERLVGRELSMIEADCHRSCVERDRQDESRI